MIIPSLTLEQVGFDVIEVSKEIGSGSVMTISSRFVSQPRLSSNVII